MSETRYFVRMDGVQTGPHYLTELIDKGIRPNDWVWCKGMETWRRARECGDICRYFRQRLTALDSKPTNGELSAPIWNKEANSTISDFASRSWMSHLARKNGEEINEYKEPAEHDYSHQPKSWIIEAILVALLCFPLTGFIAIYFSIKSTKAWKSGMKEESYSAARSAKMWCGITFFLGFIIIAIYSKMLSL